MHTDEHRSKELIEQIIGCAFTVSNTLGTGFLEKIYENALAIELRQAGLTVEQQFPIQVLYSGQPVGSYQADLIVNQQVILEIKAVQSFEPAHEAQLINYLRATGIKVGLLLNFGTPRLGIIRRVF